MAQPWQHRLDVPYRFVLIIVVKRTRQTVRLRRDAGGHIAAMRGTDATRTTYALLILAMRLISLKAEDEL